MRKINKPLGWVPKEATAGAKVEEAIVNKEEPAKKKRKTKEVEPEVVAEAPAEEVAPEPVAEVAVEPAPEVAVEQTAEVVAETASETPAEPTA